MNQDNNPISNINPFAEGDKARDRLEWAEQRIEALERSNGLLLESVTLLMRLHNEGKNVHPKV